MYKAAGSLELHACAALHKCTSSPGRLLLHQMRELCIQAPTPDVSGRRLGPAARPASRLGAALRACTPRGAAACASVCAGAAGRTDAGAALHRCRLALHRPDMAERRRANYRAFRTRLITCQHVRGVCKCCATLRLCSCRLGTPRQHARSACGRRQRSVPARQGMQRAKR